MEFSDLVLLDHKYGFVGITVRRRTVRQVPGHQSELGTTMRDLRQNGKKWHFYKNLELLKSNLPSQILLDR